MLRAIQEIQPKYVVGENVSGIINWSGGLVFDEVQSDLEAEGYEVIPFILPAASVNAPHRRERVWFVAHRANARTENLREQEVCTGEFKATPNPTSDRREWERPGIENEKGLQQRPESTRKLEWGFEGLCVQWNASNTNKLDGNVSGFRAGKISQLKAPGILENITPNTCNKGLQRSSIIRSARSIGEKSNKQSTRFFRTDWQNFPTVSPIYERNDGISDRLSGITFSKWRAESVKACGNAIVPQVVFQIFKAINEYEYSY